MNRRRLGSWFDTLHVPIVVDTDRPTYSPVKGMSKKGTSIYENKTFNLSPVFSLFPCYLHKVDGGSELESPP